MQAPTRVVVGNDSVADAAVAAVVVVICVAVVVAVVGLVVSVAVVIVNVVVDFLDETDVVEDDFNLDGHEDAVSSRPRRRRRRRQVIRVAKRTCATC